MPRRRRQIACLHAPTNFFSTPARPKSRRVFCSRRGCGDTEPRRESGLRRTRRRRRAPPWAGQSALRFRRSCAFYRREFSAARARQTVEIPSSPPSRAAADFLRRVRRAGFSARPPWRDASGEFYLVGDDVRSRSLTHWRREKFEPRHLVFYKLSLENPVRPALCPNSAR